MFYNNFFYFRECLRNTEILRNIEKYLRNKDIFVAVSSFFSFKSFSLYCKSVLSTCSSIDKTTLKSLITTCFKLINHFGCYLKIFAVKNRFVLSIKRGCMLCYLPAIWGVLIRHQGNSVDPFVSYI